MSRDFIYLASASPRRAELLQQIGVKFQVRPANVDETPRPAEVPADYVARMAADKAQAVAVDLPRDAAVLGADTIVVCDGSLLGKPADAVAAAQMLERLCGRSHEVHSAVCVCADGKATSRISVSKVRFRATTAAERAAYCATSEPLDKAGAYGIQGMAATFIEHLEGSYSGVMGLPLFETAELLAPLGLPAWLGTSSERGQPDA